MRTAILSGACTLILLLGGAASADAETTKTTYPTPTSFEQFRIADPAEEIALARSAAPASISNDAEIRTLGAQGYEVAVKGTNDWVCLVDRSWSKRFEDPEFWNPKVRAPMCLNAAAARSVLPRFQQRAGWVMTGVSKAEMAERARAALATLPPPAPESVAYMMSKQGYISDRDPPHWHPHIMVYVPLTDAKAWGANLPGAPVFHDSDDEIALTTVFIVAPKWSDGTSGMEMP
jgi:hypothetical protein